jgi:pyruvate,water dikinase
MSVCAPDDLRHVSDVVDLADVDATAVELVGGKAVGLAWMIRAGEQVPAGFCITTTAHERALTSGGVPDEDLRRELALAYERLGSGPVAVRSSAVAEDLPYASFAGQHDTVLAVRGADALIHAVRQCWASLTSRRAVSYREAAGIPDGAARMGVVVQQMVDPLAAGVLFTANPITGCRGEMVVDAAAGLGNTVVDGSATADHYVLRGDDAVTDAGGCLGPAQLTKLREAGERLQRRAGRPQDVEWAFDRNGELWLLQSRPVTTLFPLPRSSRPGTRVLLEVGHMQGMLQPFTPMGMAAMRLAMTQYVESVGARAQPDGNGVLVEAAGRMYLDITGVVRYRPTRRKLGAALTIYGPRVTAAMDRVLEDPRLAPVPGRPFRLRTVLAVAARLAPGLVAGLVGALARPARARALAFRAADDLRRTSRPRLRQGAVAQLHAAVQAQGAFAGAGMNSLLAPLYAAMLARQIAVGLLAGAADESEIDETLRGMPYNVTTEMDLALWELASAAGTHRDLLLGMPPAELSARYLAGELPEIGLGAFLRRYGHRAAAEIDVGVPRWAEDPAPVFAAIAGYLRVAEPEEGADRRFARAAKEAVAKIDELVARARRTRPVRARCAGWLLRRSRELSGLRELPKFAWLHAIAEMRRQLLAAGRELHERGLLERGEDVMFLDLPEAFAAAGGTDMREIVTTRRADHEREMRRRNVPGLMLSDGTIPEAMAPPTPVTAGTLTGMPAAPGTATGRARVILDPTDACVEPGEILVAPTTDPGWTPLFLTAAGLVTETGSPMAHGPTVAREYGIPAVICVRDATQLIGTGELITIDGAAGTVTVDAHAEPQP